MPRALCAAYVVYFFSSTVSHSHILGLCNPPYQLCFSVISSSIGGPLRAQVSLLCAMTGLIKVLYNWNFVHLP